MRLKTFFLCGMPQILLRDALGEVGWRCSKSEDCSRVGAYDHEAAAGCIPWYAHVIISFCLHLITVCVVSATCIKTPCQEQPWELNQVRSKEVVCFDVADSGAN
jgi:hypothetical protein